MSAISAGISAWNDENDDSGDQFPWDSYPARLSRYENNQHYYSNTAYSSLQKYAEVYKKNHKLYKFIRGIYNPAYRLVNFYVSNVYGGPINLESFDSGAIPIKTDNPELIDAIRQIVIWSNWQTKKSLYVRQGSKLGDVFIKCVDNETRKQVHAEIIHPNRIKEMDVDGVGYVKRVVIEYERMEGGKPTPPGKMPRVDGKTYTYTEIITPDSFQFFKAGKPWDYKDDIEGGENSEYENEYGFVPLIHVPHKDEGRDFGANVWYGSTRKIDELNDTASLTNDQIRNAVNPLYGITKTGGGNKIDAHPESRDELRILKLPEGADIKPFYIPLDFAAALENIREQMYELERDMPELALHHIRQAGNMTAPGIRAGYSDAIGNVQESRANYDAGTVRMFQMCISIAALRGYRNFEPFSLDSYKEGELDFYIADRDVIEDELTLLERATLLKDAGAPIRVIMQTMGGFTEDVIFAAEAAQEKKARDDMRAFTTQIFGETEDDNSGDITDEPATETPEQTE